MPHLLYWRQYGEYKPQPVFGPPVTAKEQWKMIKERVEKTENRIANAKTKEDINDGKQRKLSDFFVKKKGPGLKRKKGGKMV